MSRIGVASVTALCMMSLPSTAAADRGGAYSDSGGVGAFAGTSGASGSTAVVPTATGSGGGGGAAVPTCVGDAGSEGDPTSPNAIPHTGAVSYTPASADIAAELERRDPHNGAQGGWYRKDCGGAYNGYVWIPSGRGPGPAIDPAVLAQDALRYLPLPKPAVTMTPPPEKVVVNAPLWLSIDRSQWSERRATASVPGVTATVVAVPDRVVWDMGDGHQVTCTGPGTAFDPGRPYEGQRPDCGHTYARSSAGQPGPPANAYLVRATVDWRASWSSTGVVGGGSLGTISRMSEPLPVRVNEIQTVVVAASGGHP